MLRCETELWKQSLEPEFEYLTILIHEYILYKENRGTAGGVSAEFVTWGRTEPRKSDSKFLCWKQSSIVGARFLET